MEAATSAETSTEVQPPVEEIAPGSEPHAGSEGTSEGTAPETGDRDEGGKFLSREAANYRRRLRDTEVERDSLRDQLDRHQRIEVERLARVAGLAVASDVWHFGASLDTLRGEDGAIDAETVNGLVSDIVKSRPGLQARTEGSAGIGRGGSAAASMGPKVGLSQLLKPERA